MSKQLNIDCTVYNFDDPNLEAVSNCIDALLVTEFQNKDVVIRGIQSGKHELNKDELVQKILSEGTDSAAVDDTEIDFYGYACKIEASPIVLPVLEGFHKWKPKSLERPKLKVDVWMIYDAEQLENVEYTHEHYGVKAKDAYKFIDLQQKAKALLGVIKIN